MEGEAPLVGIVVEEVDPSGRPLEGAGLYLLTEEGRRLRLIRAQIFTQASMEYLHEQCRECFSSYIGKRVTVNGMVDDCVIWDASIVG